MTYDPDYVDPAVLDAHAAGESAGLRGSRPRIRRTAMSGDQRWAVIAIVFALLAIAAPAAYQAKAMGFGAIGSLAVMIILAGPSGPRR